jgi:glycyl-tRNA synthetase
MTQESTVNLETIVELAKRRGFIFPGSEIYGGLRNSWDYGPLGVQLKNNIRDAWWRHYVKQRQDMVGLDAATLMNPKVWEASGHVANFNDPMVDCKKCQARLRADDLIAQFDSSVSTEKMTLEQYDEFLGSHDVPCTNCGTVGQLTKARKFNLLFETSLGTVDGSKQSVYLRGELAQSMFVDFKRVVDSMRPSIPFGIAQVGKVFRNEITPGNFTFRTLEFDLMEFEYFIKEADWEKTFDEWLADMQEWVTKNIGISKDKLRVREHAPEERAFYSKRTVDIEYSTSFGWKEMFGIAYRTDYDLKKHMEATGADLTMTDLETNEKFVPHVVEPTFGLSRLTLFAMLDAYHEEEVNGEKRIVMKFKPNLAPYQVAVLPLSKKPELMKVSLPLAKELSQEFSCDYDVTQSIGRRYRRQDEIGTPYCVTVDFDSLEDKAVTVRDRDTMTQERMPIEKVSSYIKEKLTL